MDDGSRGYPWHAYRLHDRANRTCGGHARRTDGARNGDGVDLRRCRRVLGRTPTLINLFVFWLWEIPLAWWLSRHAGLGAHGVFVALTVAYSTLAVVSAVLFRRGRWKLKSV